MEEFNALEAEFDAADSELDTTAREKIGEGFWFVARAYGFRGGERGGADRQSGMVGIGGRSAATYAPGWRSRGGSPHPIRCGGCLRRGSRRRRGAWRPGA
ncbi:DUF5713 family protein [Nocardia cyriacigeorgica]|uniref:DUF5713 family protein n=1 Tax=Nocardia cyriacigeorgica TaxID=135487 RepID=UPI003D7D17DB